MPAAMHVEESIDINRPPQTVWDLVADPTKDPSWCPKVKSVEAVAAGRWKVVHKPVPLRPPLDLSLQQLELDPPFRRRLRQEDTTCVFAVEYRLEAITSGTRFTQTSEFEWKTLPRFLHKTFARGVRRDVRAQLHALKKVLERA